MVSILDGSTLIHNYISDSYNYIQGVFLPPLKVLCTNNLIKARLGVSRPIYVNVDTPNLAFFILLW